MRRRGEMSKEEAMDLSVYIERLLSEPSRELVLAAEEALVALGVWKLSDDANPYREIGKDLRKQMNVAHDLLLNALLASKGTKSTPD
jgi:hypothetical protein